MADARSNDVDLGEAFYDFENFRTMMSDSLLPALKNAKSAAVAVLALECLYRSEKDQINAGELSQFNPDKDINDMICEFLRTWRCESPLKTAYGKRTKIFLRSLKIFETFTVPLFIDDYGDKVLMKNFSGREPIAISLTEPIVHVTHTKEKNDIYESKNFQPSAVKNAIKGIWFSLKGRLESDGNRSLLSVYGKWAFETTLENLGISGLHQGEVVAYKEEVNFILYASKTTKNTSVEIATEPAMKSVLGDLRLRKNRRFVEITPRAAISIFVPWHLLSEAEIRTLNSITPYEVSHGPFCVKEKRSRHEVWACDDLSSPQ